MYENRFLFRVVRMAKVLKVSESGYYKWLSRMGAQPTEKELSDERLSAEIHEVFRQSRGSFGARKITSVLNIGRGEPVNHKRVERLMQEHGLFSKASKAYIITTDSGHQEPVADNLLQRDFEACRPNEKMVSDTTAVRTDQGILYVAGILDLCGRMPVGLAMSRQNDRFLVMSALADMLTRGYGKKGCILHSDRGSTDASEDYRKMLDENGLICSMSRKGDCWDNAPMECFWGKMKGEWLKCRYRNFEDAARDIYEYVWEFYPSKRPHETFGYKTPLEIYSRG